MINIQWSNDLCNTITIHRLKYSVWSVHSKAPLPSAHTLKSISHFNQKYILKLFITLDLKYILFHLISIIT